MLLLQLEPASIPQLLHRRLLAKRSVDHRTLLYVRPFDVRLTTDSTTPAVLATYVCQTDVISLSCHLKRIWVIYWGIINDFCASYLFVSYNRRVLADRTSYTVWSAIGIIMSSVCTVSLSVTLCTVAKRHNHLSFCPLHLPCPLKLSHPKTSNCS